MAVKAEIFLGSVGRRFNLWVGIFGGGSSMSKKRSVAHSYRRKKDRLEISIENYSLGEKKKRKALIKTIAADVEQLRGSKHGKKGKRAKNPIKETRLPQVGD
jgi:hypothetical protein